MAWVQPAWLTAVTSWLPASAVAQRAFAFCTVLTYLVPPLVNWAGNSSARVSGAGSRARDPMCPHGPSDGDGLGEGLAGDGRPDAAACGEAAAAAGDLWFRANQM